MELRVVQALVSHLKTNPRNPRRIILSGALSTLLERTGIETGASRVLGAPLAVRAWRGQYQYPARGREGAETR